MSIVDAFNEVGNNFAISSSGIGDALQRSAASLAAAGNTMEESIGLITAMNSIIQNPETVGTTLKTVTMYLRAAKTEAESAGVEIDGMADSASSLREKMKSLTGVDIMVDSNTFKSTYQILKEISGVWDKLSDATQSNVLNLMGGKRNANAIAALIQNFEDAEAAMKAATNSFGSASAENEKYLDSINGKIAVMKASFEEMSSAVINSGVINFFVELATVLENAVTWLAKMNLILPALIGAGAGVKGIMGFVGGMKQVSSLFDSFKTSVASASDGATALRLLEVGVDGLTPKQKKLVSSLLTSSSAFKMLTAEEQKNALALLSVESATSAASGGFKKLMGSMSLTNKIMAIAVIVTSVIGIIKDIKNAAEEAVQNSIEASNELIDSYSEAQSNFQNNTKSLKSLRSQFDELSKGVDTNGKNVSLTAEQYEEYKSIVDQIIQLSPGVVSGYNKEGQALVNYTTLLDDAIAKQDEYLKQDREIYLSGGEALFEGKANEYSQVLKDFEAAEAKLGQAFNNGTDYSSWKSFFSGATKEQIEAVSEALDGLGIALDSEAVRRMSISTGVEIGENGLDNLLILYEKQDEFITLLRNSGQYAEDEIEQVRSALYGLAEPYSKLKEINSELADYLMTRAEYAGDGEGWDWYKKLSPDSLEAFRAGLMLVTDASKSFNENIEAAKAYGEEFLRVYSTESAQRMVQLAQGLKDGTVSLDEYNKALNYFSLFSFGQEEVISSLMTYFEGLSNSVQVAGESSEEAATKFTGLADSLKQLEKGYNILNTAGSEMANKGGISADTLKSIADLMEDGEKITDYLTVEDGLLKLDIDKWKTRSELMAQQDIEALRQQKEELEELISIRDTLNSSFATDEVKEEMELLLSGYTGNLDELDDKLAETTLRIQLYEAALQSAGDVSASISGLKTVVDLMGKVHSEDRDTLSTLEVAADIAQESGKEITDFLSMFRGELGLNEDAIVQWATSAINSWQGISGVSEEAKQVLIDLMVAETKASITSDKVASAHNKVQEAISGMAEAGEYVKLTTEAYQSLIETDARYVNAVEYQNGVYTLNSEKHAQVTQKILEETRAMAEEGKQAILMSDEYQRLNQQLQEFGALDSYDDLQRLLDLKAQIQGYDVLANEIDNATSAYERWLNRETDNGMDRFAQAQKAYELINSTLNDSSSDYYGRIGREEFNLGVDFILGENIELNTPEFEAAMKKAKKYLGEGAEGATAFWDDLVKAGLMDKTTGVMDSTIAEISEKLGISEELVRTMIDRFNEYQDESGKIQVVEPEVKDEETKTALQESIETLEDLREQVDTLNETPLNLSIENEEETTASLTALQDLFTNISGAVATILSDPTSFSLDELAAGCTTIQEHLSTIQSNLDKVNGSGLKVDGSQSEEALKSLDASAATVAEAFTGILNTLNAIISSRDALNATGINVQTGNSSPLLGKVSDKLSEIINKLATIKKNSNLTVRISEVTTKTTVGDSGSANASGTAAVRGTAMASGGKTLVGELGMETVVDPNKSQWYTVGENGAEFVTLPENAIVFNHKQTKELLDSGHIESRGEAMALGNLMKLVMVTDSGTGGSSKKSTSTVKKSDSASSSGSKKPTTSTKSSSKKSSSKKSSSSSSSKTESQLESLKKKYEELNKETEHLIEHQEFLYKQAQNGLDYSGMEKSLEEQVVLYKKLMSDSQAAVKDMISKGAKDTDEELQTMEKAYWDAYDKLYETLDKINSLYVDALQDKIDNIQKAYDNLAKAAEDFNSYGGISVDSFQELLKNGVQYLSLLENQNGQYVINTEGIQKIIAAQKEQLAVESAVSYLKQLQTAISDNQSNAVANLVDLTNQLSSSTWDAVYAQAELLRSNLSDSQYAQVIANIDALRAISSSVITDLSKNLDDTSSTRKEVVKDQRDALEKILELTEDLIKKESEDRIDAINDEIDAYKKIIDLKKESLKTTKEENDYSKNVAEKTKDIAALQTRINQMKLDDSREARAERAKLEEQLADLQGELGDLQSDHAYELQTDALDKAATEYEESRQQEIEAIEDSISSAEKLYQAALVRLETGWDTIYQELIDWNTEAGSSLNSEITENWEKAIEAVKLYGSYVKAVTGLESEEDSFDNGTNASSNVVAEGNLTPIQPKATTPAQSNTAVAVEPETSEKTETQAQPVTKVQVVSGRWNVRSGPKTSYKILGVAKAGTKLTYRGKTSGDWYAVTYNGKNAWINKGGSKLIKELPKYHTGGIVGEGGTDKDNEVLSVLEKGEMVLTEKMKKAAYTLVDFKDYLEKKLGNAIGSVSLPSPQTPSLAGATSITRTGVDVGSINFSPSIQVEINHSGTMSEQNARQYGKTIAETAVNELYEGFRRRGIGKIFGSKPTK